MTRSIIAAALVFAASVPAAAQDKAALAGNWTVDLRPSPSAPAYLKPMVIAIGSDGAVTGEFYQHAIEKGRGGATNGRPCFAFRTSDNSGPYQTSGCLVGERIEGQTWSEGRNFVLTWTAVRTAKGQ